MKIIRDIIETTLQNHGVPYTEDELDESVLKASRDGGTGPGIIDRIEWAISPLMQRKLAEIQARAKAASGE